MKKQSHTPGPWRADFNTAYGMSQEVTIRQPSGYGIARVSLQHRDGDSQRETAHDAFLIAAAPEMYSVCLKALVELGDDENLENFKELFLELKSVIAKARGEK